MKLVLEGWLISFCKFYQDFPLDNKKPNRLRIILVLGRGLEIISYHLITLTHTELAMDNVPVGSLAQDPSAFQYYSGGEYGEELRLSHPHPGLSGAGAGTLIKYGPSSNHTGVVNHGMADGSVQSISEDIDAAAYMFLITRNGADPNAPLD